MVSDNPVPHIQPNPQFPIIEILVIFGSRDFEEPDVPCHSHVLCLDNAIQVRKRGASRVRVAMCLENVPACPTMPALPHDRSGANLGKSKILGSEFP